MRHAYNPRGQMVYFYVGPKQTVVCMCLCVQMGVLKAVARSWIYLWSLHESIHSTLESSWDTPYCYHTQKYTRGSYSTSSKIP